MIILIIITSFTISLPVPYAFAQYAPPMPAPGSMAPLSANFTGPMLAGIQIDLKNPLHMNFLMDKGEDKISEESRQAEYTKIIKYFLSSLTVPGENFWVNLSPYEKNRIIPDDLSQTQMGLDLLAQDYLLKQITSSLMYPEGDIGKELWERIYNEAGKRFGTTEIPLNILNKVWVVPDKAVIYEREGTAWVIYSHLKVLLEEDYLAMNKTGLGHPLSTLGAMPKNTQMQEMTNQLVREVILPEIENEVNEGKNFTVLRQIVSAMVLSHWFKQALKNSLITEVYVDKGKFGGIETADKNLKLSIYDRYIEAFKKGVYEYVQEDYDPQTKEIIPRKFFSGGFALDSAMISTVQNPLTVDPAIMSAVGNRFAGIQRRGLDTTSINLLPLGQNITPQNVDFKTSDSAMLVDDQRVSERRAYFQAAPAEEVITAYYQTKQNMLVALNTDNEAKFKEYYEEFLAISEPLGEKAQTLSEDELLGMVSRAYQKGTEEGPINPKLITRQTSPQGPVLSAELLRKEFAAVGRKGFSQQMRENIEVIVGEMSEDLAREETERKSLQESMSKDIYTYHIDQFLPRSILQGDFKEWKKIAGGIIWSTPRVLGNAMGSFSRYSQRINMHAIDDEIELRLVLKHELAHYLMFKGIIKFPFNSEIFTFAVSAMELMKGVAPGSADEDRLFGSYGQFLEGEGAKQLYQKGRQLGREGKTSFMIDPSKSGNQANYLVFNQLIVEARAIYEQLGLDTGRLKAPYSAQRAVGIILGGILMGMMEKDPSFKPMLKLRIYLEALYEYFGESSPELKRWEDGLIEEAVNYVGGATGQTVNFVNTAEGVWRFHSLRDSENRTGISQLIGSRADAKPRRYDGESPEDLKGQKEAARERVLGHAFLAMAKQRYGFRDLTAKLPEEINKNEDVLYTLWDRLLLPKITKIRADITAASHSTDTSFRPVNRFVSRVLKDIYEIEDDWLAESRFLSLPLHVQYIDSLIYRWYHYGRAGKDGLVINNLLDGRIRSPENSLVEAAVFRSAGSLDADEGYGWIYMLFYPDKITDAQLIDIVKNKIWPEYKKLYEIALEEET
ncbi:MAG: hypothetical protein HQL27_04275, partial [Candidatus Omnitrophica bacterium]|nr:hypothetical protein [Candidatus Omnitrophota bacterium]